MAMVFSSSHTTQGLYFAAVQDSTQQQQQSQKPSVTQACPAAVGAMSTPLLRHNQQQVLTKSVNSDSWCKQFVSERQVHNNRNGTSADHDGAQWGRVKDDRRVATTKMVFKLLKQNDRNGSYAVNMTALAKTSSNFKQQTRPLIREGAPHQQTPNCLAVIKFWSRAPDGCLAPRQTGRLIVGRNKTLTLTLSGSVELVKSLFGEWVS
jgi:hypothetical protein